MTARRSTEAERLARHNAEMKYALEHNCTVLAARKRMNREWLEAFERAPDQLIERVRRCGTADHPAGQPSSPREIAGDPAPQAPHFWWQDL